MNPQFNVRNHALLMALAAAYPVIGHAAGAARVEFASGPVVAITAAGVQRELSRGAELHAGDAVRTGDNARLQLRFSDGAMMSLQAQTEFRIDDYKYNGQQDGQERGFFSLIRGGLRTITGLVGRSNRDNYRVTTPVATIGIRGTEYSAVFSNTGPASEGTLNLATGEGRVEICNAGGCVIVAGGQSAVVTGTTPAVISPIKAVSSSSTAGTNTASQVTSSPLEPYSVAENVSGDGSPAAVTVPQLTSGSGYAIAYADNTYPPAYYGGYDTVTTTFGSASKLQEFTNGTYTYTAGTVTSAFSVDGVIGWGVWSGGTQNGGYGGPAPLADLHYVVGKPSSAADLQNLTGTVGTYTLIGYTTPTATNGVTATNFNASLTANFAGASTTVSTAISMDIGGHSLAANVSGMLMNGAATFSGSTIPTFDGNNSTGTISVNGLFAGSNASHAGISYAVDTYNMDGLGTISGAAAFKR